MSRVDELLGQLTLEEKCRLVGGASTWRTHPIDRVGVPEIKVSDGPIGVRGEGHGASRTPGVVVPSGIALGASWDPELVERLGRLLGEEAIRKSAHVLLGPTVNLHRTPIGGRTFECYSEDAELTARLAVGFVRGVQSRDVAVTVKHFVANDTEIDRFTVDAELDERTLREHHLRPFEAVVRDAGAWGVMSAYNKLDGEHCAENRALLTGILREEWGFDGFVVSDWFGVHDTVGAATAGLNLEMPGPTRVYGPKLEAAVERGEVTEADVDRIARDLLVLMERTHAWDRSSDGEEETVRDPAERRLCRHAAIAGTVLLRNEGDLLPLVAGQLSKVAVIGPNARMDRSMGGGSASLTPLTRRTLLDAVTERLGDAEVVFEPGVRIDKLTPLVHSGQLGDGGLRLEYVNGQDPDGEVVATGRVDASAITFFGSTPPDVDPNSFSLRASGTYVAEVDGLHEIGVVTTGPSRVEVGGRVIVDDPRGELPRGEEYFGYGSVEVVETIELSAGEPTEIRATWSGGDGFGALRIGVRPPTPANLLDRAVTAAADADVAIVMVGTTEEWETEGSDRTSIDLPGGQDELVERVVAANPRTVVIVNAGSPVAMPWASDVPAVLTPFFAGMEQAEALVDILLGEADPGGRLPVTYPFLLGDAPAMEWYAPVEGVQRYREGWRFGYRGHQANEVEPLFWFGHGLSYGRATWGDATASADTMPVDGSVEVELPVTVIGDRSATVVVQGYVAPIDPPVERAPMELRAWSKLVVEPGAAATARLIFDAAAFRRWDGGAGEWVVDPGDYDLVLASSAAAEHARLRVAIG
ncbi:MAG: glycoside hydrolase family 3 C-terminal domain-containing protein [Actinomycetota bacterium]